MKWLFPMCLAGAVIGGFPGAVFAFRLVAGTGIRGLAGEATCFTVNLLLGLGGAFAGMLLAKALRGQAQMQLVEIVFPVLLGVLGGIAGYVWLDWEISHAAPRCKPARDS